MKKLKPNIKSLDPKPRPFYGSNILTTSDASRKKSNFICADYNCKYSSRRWAMLGGFGNNQKNSSFSTTCPVHKAGLINIGSASKMPKPGSKERRDLIYKYSNLNTLLGQ